VSVEERVVLASSDFDLLLRSVTKHLKDTEFDHDQSTHGGGGGSSQSVSATAADARAESLHASRSNFESRGGRVEIADPDIDSTDALREEIGAVEASIKQNLQDAGEKMPHEVAQGIYFAKVALYGLDDGDDVFLARGVDGSLVGALSGRQRDEESYEVVFLGSTGQMSGVGSALMAQVMNRAAEAGLGLWLISDEGAEDWWTSQVGLTFAWNEEEGDHVGTMPAGQVEGIARSLLEQRRGKR
jgi:hypothetical protein